MTSLMRARSAARRSARDDVGDAVGQQFELLGSAHLLEVLGDACGDGLAGDLLAAPSSEQDEWEIAVALPDRLQELDAVHPRHLVVAHDAVDSPRSEAFEPRTRGMLAHDCDVVGDALQVGRRQVGDAGIVVDVEHARPLAVVSTRFDPRRTHELLWLCVGPMKRSRL